MRTPTYLEAKAFLLAFLFTLNQFCAYTYLGTQLTEKLLGNILTGGLASIMTAITTVNYISGAIMAGANQDSFFGKLNERYNITLKVLQAKEAAGKLQDHAAILREISVETDTPSQSQLPTPTSTVSNTPELAAATLPTTDPNIPASDSSWSNWVKILRNAAGHEAALYKSLWGSGSFYFQLLTIFGASTATKLASAACALITFAGGYACQATIFTKAPTLPTAVQTVETPSEEKIKADLENPLEEKETPPVLATSAISSTATPAPASSETFMQKLLACLHWGNRSQYQPV